MKSKRRGCEIDAAASVGASGRRTGARDWSVALVLVVGLVTGCDKAQDGPRTTVAPPAPEAERRPGPSYDDKLVGAERLIAKGEVGAALSAARELVEDRRTDARGWIALATAHQLAEDPKEALNAGKAAVEFAPGDAAAWVALGAAQRAVGELTEATTSLRKALTLMPSSRAARFNLAGVAADRRDFAAAKAELETLLVADEDDVETRFLLARVLIDAGDAVGARRELERLVGLHPGHVRAQRTLAAMLWEADDYKGAFERAKIATRIQSGDLATNNLLEASFYVVAAARLTCEAGARPWSADRVVAVLEALEKEEDLEGSGTFVELDEKFGESAAVQARVGKLAERCKK